VPRRDLPARESLSASPPLLSICSSAPPSTHCDKNAPRTAATVLPDKILPGSPPTPSTCRKQTTARPSIRALSGVAKMPSSSPCLPSRLPLPPILPENPLHSQQSPPATTHSALRRPSRASTTDRPEKHTGGGPRSACCALFDLRVDQTSVVEPSTCRDFSLFIGVREGNVLRKVVVDPIIMMRWHTVPYSP
jgi:hypothetical protein